MALLHYLITSRLRYVCSFFFFFNDPATPEIYTLSLHDALPISFLCQGTTNTPVPLMAGTKLQAPLGTTAAPAGQSARSEEHTSELQSHSDLVCRLLLEKKKFYELSEVKN